MSQKAKLLEKIRNGPNNTTLEEILTLMNSFGFNQKKTRDGFKFWYPQVNGIFAYVARPHGREKKVLSVYVKGCLNAIDRIVNPEEM